jgi:hypothetical protein
VHFNYSEYVVKHMGVLRFSLRKWAGVEHDYESGDGKACMDGTKKYQAQKLLYFGPLFLEFHQRWDGDSDDQGTSGQVEDSGAT